MAIVNRKSMFIVLESSDSQESNIYLDFLGMGISSFSPAIWVVSHFCCGLPSINLPPAFADVGLWSLHWGIFLGKPSYRKKKP